jgi:hypothetical protein
MWITPLLCPFLTHADHQSISPDNLELSGVVISAQEEKKRSHSELLAGMARKSNAILAKWGHSATSDLSGGSSRYKNNSSLLLVRVGTCAIPEGAELLMILSKRLLFQA